jgi:hydroxypyruvate reductase 1
MGQLLQGGTLGVIGAGRIGQAYARMMIEGHKMNVIYYDLKPKPELESFVKDYSEFLVRHDEVSFAPKYCMLPVWEG